MPVLFCITGKFERGLWDELPVKQGIDNAL